MRSSRWWGPVAVLGSIVGLLIVGYIAIRHPSPVVTSLVFTGAWVILLLSTLGARFGRARAFWHGFVVFGWGYALLAFAPGAWTEIRPYLATSRMLDALHGVMGLPEWPFIPGRGYDEELLLGPSVPRWSLTEAGSRYQRIGHSFASVLHGLSGGLFAAFIVGRARVEGAREGSP